MPGMWRRRLGEGHVGIKMRLSLFLCCVLISCGSPPPPQPQIRSDVSGLAQEAITAIQSKKDRITNEPQNFQLWQELGKLYQSHGLDESSILAYEYSNQIQNNSETTYLLSLAYAHTGQYEKAVQIASSLDSYIPAIWRQGFWLLDLGDFAGAKAKFDLAVKTDNTAIAAMVGGIRANIALGNFQDAIKSLQDIQLRGVSHPYITYLLGTALQRNGQTTEASPLLQMPMPGPPQWDDPWYSNMKLNQKGFAASVNRAMAKLDKGNLDGSLADLKRLSTNYPQNAMVLNNLASVYLELGQTEKAIDVLVNSLKWSPNDAPTQFSLGLAFMQINEIDRAEEQVLKAIELQPAFAAAYSTAGRIALMKRNLPLAKERFLQSISIGNNDVVCRELLAMTLLDLNELEAALRQFEIVIQVAPLKTLCIGGKAVALSRLGRQDQAVAFITEAKRAFPDDANITRAMQNILQSGGSK